MVVQDSLQSNFEKEEAGGSACLRSLRGRGNPYQMGYFIWQWFRWFSFMAWSCGLFYFETWRHWNNFRKSDLVYDKNHIQRDSISEWNFPNHRDLMKHCGLKLVNIYIWKYRGILRVYFE